MIEGIPYIQDIIDMNEFHHNMKEKDKDTYIQKDIMVYDLVSLCRFNDIIVLIDDFWLAYLKDIHFNYRDKEVYIEYYQYDIYPLLEPVKSIYSNILYRGNRNSYYIRYNYLYSRYNIDLGITLYTYNVRSEEYIAYTLVDWINVREIDNNVLYSLYLDSCYKQTMIDEYEKGYNYIEKRTKQLKNFEYNLRNKYLLDSYSKDSERTIDDYRDVREYKYEEIVVKKGFRQTIETYKKRRLWFESYLYCNLRKGNSNYLFDKLKTNKDYVKIGDNIKLIIKGYWLNGIERPKNNVFVNMKQQN